MSQRPIKLQTGFGLLTTGLLLAVSAAGQEVDLVLAPAHQIAAQSSTVTIDFLAQAAIPQEFHAIDVILSWDPNYLDLEGADDSGTGYPPGWFLSGFLPDPDGINDDLHDGDALFTVLAQPGTPATATPEGLLVAGFSFTGVALSDGAHVMFLPELGLDAQTRVYGPSGDVTGDITSVATIRVVPTTLRLELEDAQAEYAPGATLVVPLYMHAASNVQAYQACVMYDEGVLDFVSGVYTSTPFPVHFWNPPLVSGGAILLDGSLLPFAPAVSGNALLATFAFEVRSDALACVLDVSFSFCADSFFSYAGSTVPTELEGSVPFDVYPLPPVITTTPPGDEFCPGELVTLDAGAGYASYLWSPGGETTQTITVTASSMYEVIVTDTQGCTYLAAVEITFADDLPPVINCPNDPMPTANPGACEAAVVVPPPDYSDNCPGAHVVCDYSGTDDASGVYPVGTTPVTWTVTDIAGQTSTCSHNVTVNLYDFILFAACLAGPDVLSSPCEPAQFAAADLDGDGDVDLEDAAEYQRIYSDCTQGE